jgi:hypothetical protein
MASNCFLPFVFVVHRVFPCMFKQKAHMQCKISQATKATFGDSQPNDKMG